MKTALIKKPDQNEWIEFISRLGLVSINQAREVFLSGDYSQISDFGQKALYTAGRGKTLSLEGNLIGSKMTFDEALLLAETYNAERNYLPKDEILAYVHYERAVFWKKFSEHLSSMSLFHSARRLAESESMNAIIDFQISALHLLNETGSSESELSGWINYFAQHEMRVMQLIAFEQLAIYHRKKKEYARAESLLIEALELAIDFNYSFMVEQVKSLHGYVLYCMGENKEARQVFHSMIKGVESKYLKTTNTREPHTDVL